MRLILFIVIYNNNKQYKEINSNMYIMVNYQFSKVYKVTCDVTGEFIVDTTTKKHLSQRMADHMSKFKLYKNGKAPHNQIYDIIERGDYTVELLESKPCENKDELNQLEFTYKKEFKYVKPIKHTTEEPELKSYYKYCSMLRQIGTDCFE